MWFKAGVQRRFAFIGFILWVAILSEPHEVSGQSHAVSVPSDTVDRPEAESIEILLPTRQGQLSWRSIGMAIGDALFLDPESVGRLLPSGDFQVGSAHVLLSMMSVEMATRGGIRFKPTEDVDGSTALLIRCRRGSWMQRLPSRSSAPSTIDLDDDWQRRTVDESGRRAPLLVLLHGIQSDPDAFAPMRAYFREQGYSTAAVGYDFRQPVDASARDVARLVHQTIFTGRSAQDIPPIVLVGHSMGGLVARYWIDHPDIGSNEIDTLITLGSPHAGSQWASLPPVLDLVGEDAADVRRIVGVVLHRTSDPGMKDLHPESDFLAELNVLSPNPEVRRIGVSGASSPVSPESAIRIRDAIRKLDKPRSAVRWMRPRILPLIEGLDEWARGRGDGIVTVESSRLPGADRQHVVEASHFQFVPAARGRVNPVWILVNNEARMLTID